MCNMHYVGMAQIYTFIRKSSPLVYSTWTEMKNGFGSLANGHSSEYYFVGLKQLHVLTQQANYVAWIYAKRFEDTNGIFYYYNFNVGK